MTKTPTPHQRNVLHTLARVATRMAARPGRFVSGNDCGGPKALDHLHRKGYVEREVRYGPRDGEYYYYRPNVAGWALLDSEQERRESQERKQTLAEIDSLLIRAREENTIALIRTTTEDIRGYVGHVERSPATGALLIRVGQRLIAADSIIEVLASAERKEN